MENKLQKIVVQPNKLANYKKLTPKVLTELRKYKKKYQNLKVSHVNATELGGGVAEMLRSQVSLERDLGLDSNWYVIPPNEPFFEVTKKIHNLMQGKKGSLTKKEIELYLKHNKLVANLLDRVKTDVLFIHDPQPAAALYFMKNLPKLSIWRCHIDTSEPNPKVWKFLYKYLSLFNSLIFTSADFVNESIPPEKVNLMTPVIDPFSSKNRLMSMTKAKSLLTKSGVDTNKPLVTQVSRLDPWKDPMGVIDSFLLAKKSIPALQLAFVAQMASDDPEGISVAKSVKNYAKNKDGILFFINVNDNDEVVNAFQTASNVIIQKSLREGFALTVTEALWKEAIVIGGNVGGIRLQIKDSKNGYLVNSPNEAAKRIVEIIKNPEKMRIISKNARETVRQNYLMPHLILNEVKVFDKYF